MKTFSPRPELIFVGQEHGKKISLPPQLKAATERYGAWYEGAGGDKIQGVSYKGSWDDEIAKDVSGYPRHFLFVIFANTNVNNQKQILVGSGTIFDRILRTQGSFGYFKKKRFSEDALSNFLKEMGDEYLKLSRAQATKENVSKFIDKGEKDMWESGNTPANRMADKANKYRDMWLLSRPKGVYFVGSDHIKNLELLFKNKDRDWEKSGVGNK
jgi:hypothetical protein